MSIELVGLAYDRKSVDDVWGELPILHSVRLILEDEFRRKVDPRSQLYHKGQIELLSEFEQMLKQGGAGWTVTEFQAARFKSGTEEFPTAGGELAFDFHLIRHFASLAMVDDFLVAEPFLRELLRKTGFLKNGSTWSLLETRDFDGVVAALGNARMNDIFDATQALASPNPEVSAENLVRNYVEFFNYSRNNRLVPFFFNSETDFRKWGDLIERKNRRNETVVDLAMKSRLKSKPLSAEMPDKGAPRKSIEERLKVRRETDSLLEGLKDPDPLIRQKTAESLQKLAEPSILPQLSQALADHEPEVRLELVRAIASLEDPLAVDVLISTAEKDDSLSVQLVAAYGLTKRGEPRILPVLLDGIEKGKPHFSVLIAFHPGLARDKPALDRLKVLAKHENAEVRREVAFVLGRLKGKDVFDTLQSLSQDEDEEVARNSMYSLWNNGYQNCAALAAKFAKSSSENLAVAGQVVSGWIETLGRSAS